VRVQFVETQRGRVQPVLRRRLRVDRPECPADLIPRDRVRERFERKRVAQVGRLFDHALRNAPHDPRLVAGRRGRQNLRPDLGFRAEHIEQDRRRERGLRILPRHREQCRRKPPRPVRVAEPEQVNDEEHLRRL
jgi:hypothetical protein